MNIVNISDTLQMAIRMAQSLAREYQQEAYTPAHLLRGLMHEEIGVQQFIASLGKEVDYVIEWAEVRMEGLGKVGRLPDIISPTDESVRVLEEADVIRIKLGLPLITPICVLAAICKPTVGFTPDELRSFPIKEAEIFNFYLGQTSLAQSVTATGEKTQATSGASLAKYCIDRLNKAQDGTTDPVIGREMETRMIVEILCRRTKPNVILMGEAGVGKTALVDGLAQDILQKRVPSSLEQAQLFELDLGALIAGASYKGEVEDRLKNILKEIRVFSKAILFIDEIHTLLDAKGPFGNGLGNLLKPALARGEITVIGATTRQEYRKFLEPDAAFIRRFERVVVEEPDSYVATEMVKQASGRYTEYHGISIRADVAAECVRLAKRYLRDRRLPDAALDLLDRTLAAIKLMNDSSIAVLNDIEERLRRLENLQVNEVEREEAYVWLGRQIQNQISPILLAQLSEIPQEVNGTDALVDRLKSKIASLRTHASQRPDELTKENIAAMVSYKTGIPIGKIRAGEQERLMHMQDFLRARVVGQDHALDAVADAILESRSGLNKKGQPVGSFFLLGPTGTGKTELAKSIAAFLFNDEKAMIRFDMSEFKEEHSAALLYGAPPGYVGYEEGGLLVNKIRQHPYTVLLFDEIEKAHPSVFDTFLQILDEGHMHDRLGREGDFTNALILFTSNISSDWISSRFSMGEIPEKAELLDRMTAYFRPEFLARLSEIVPFAPIQGAHLVRIFEIQLESLLMALEQQGIGMQISKEAIEMLATQGFNPKYGARQLATVIRNELKRPISKLIISGVLRKGLSVHITKHAEQTDLLWQIHDSATNPLL